MPNIPIPQSGGYANGQTISQTRGFPNEVILIIPDAPQPNQHPIDRRSFLKLSSLETRGYANEERRHILAPQAEAALPYYEENKAQLEEKISNGFYKLSYAASSGLSQTFEKTDSESLLAALVPDRSSL